MGKRERELRNHRAYLVGRRPGAKTKRRQENRRKRRADDQWLEEDSEQRELGRLRELIKKNIHAWRENHAGQARYFVLFASLERRDRLRGLKADAERAARAHAGLSHLDWRDFLDMERAGVEWRSIR